MFCFFLCFSPFTYPNKFFRIITAIPITVTGTNTLFNVCFISMLFERFKRARGFDKQCFV
ncbi:hypothetical protein EVA_05668 [gut metagenome]|uniref:Uncharacterized protein n=1 Tax=gut metagenome TaxID=749906 RepID=J9D0Y6_9ZZZZ